MEYIIQDRSKVKEYESLKGTTVVGVNARSLTHKTQVNQSALSKNLDRDRFYRIGSPR